MTILKVPYFSQRDSATSQGGRMCFSSSCAMLLESLKPGTLKGLNGDDQYLARVRRFGDTTEAAAQLQALASYGVKARFVQNATWATIEGQISRGIPVPIGMLHHGPVTAPSGGGHWILAIGHDRDVIIVHDPYGDLDLVRGGYLSTTGAALRYSRRNLAPRWMVDGPGTGWAIIAER